MKYKYSLMNRYEVLDTCEANNLSEALEKFSSHGYFKVTHEVNIGMFAIIKPEKGFDLGIKWEEIKLPEIPPINSFELTAEEQNLIKDILKEIGKHKKQTSLFATEVCGMTENKFNLLADSIFGKLQI